MHADNAVLWDGGRHGTYVDIAHETITQGDTTQDIIIDAVLNHGYCVLVELFVVGHYRNR